MLYHNIGKKDRFFRVLISLILLILGIVWFPGYITAFLMFLVAIVLFVTGIVGWDPLYSWLNYSSRRVGLDKISKRDIEEAVRNYDSKAPKARPHKLKNPKTDMSITKKTTSTKSKSVAKKTPTKTTSKASTKSSGVSASKSVSKSATKKASSKVQAKLKTKKTATKTPTKSKPKTTKTTSKSKTTSKKK